MIQFDRIEQATYPNKPLDSMDFNAKDSLNSSSVRPNENFQKNQKFEIRSFDLFSNFRFRFDTHVFHNFVSYIVISDDFKYPI